MKNTADEIIDKLDEKYGEDNYSILDVVNFTMKELRPEWIKIGDILPEPFEKVLVYAYPPSLTMSGQKIMAIDYIREFKHLKGSMRDRLENNKGFSYNVTHWMPIPQPPKKY